MSKRLLWLLTGLVAFAIRSQAGISPTAAAAEPIWIENIWQGVEPQAGLADAIGQLLRRQPSGSSAVTIPDPDLVVATYRIRDKIINNLVLQLHQTPAENTPAVLNPHGVARAQLGESVTDTSDRFLNLILQHADYRGNEADIASQRRAFQLASTGDLTLLREQTVEPLHFIAVLPHASQYLPASLRSRVTAVVLTGDLNYGQWHARLHFVTDNTDSAAQVGNVAAAWRDLAGTLAELHAAQPATGRRLREAINASTVQVTDNRVVISASLPATTVVRVVKEATGHGGGCAAGGLCDRNKVAICHNQPNKGPTTICVSPSAVATHIAQHGDYCGPCVGNSVRVEVTP